MISQKRVIRETNWDNLIILDACRFDYFKEFYSKYFDGDLKKADSEAGNTTEWLNKTWVGYYEDITYYSANPYVNSCGTEFDGFNAIEHFPRIIDVWNWGWDNMFTTVLPKQFLKCSINTGDRKIFHFIQPHRPWITEPTDTHNWTSRDSAKKQEAGNIKIRRFVGEKLVRVIGKDRTRALSRFLFGGTTKCAFLRAVEKIGVQKAIERYKENIKIPLKFLQSFIPKLVGKTIVSADHGEAFGDKGVWGHEKGRTGVDKLVEIPWLEIDRNS